MSVSDKMFKMMVEKHHDTLISSKVMIGPSNTQCIYYTTYTDNMSLSPFNTVSFLPFDFNVDMVIRSEIRAESRILRNSLSDLLSRVEK